MTPIAEIAGRCDVAFSFHTGPAAVSSVGPRGLATVAIRMRQPRGWFEPQGTVAGWTVDVLGVEASAVEGYTRVAVRFPAQPGE